MTILTIIACGASAGLVVALVCVICPYIAKNRAQITHNKESLRRIVAVVEGLADKIKNISIDHTRD